MSGVIVVDAGRIQSTCLRCDAYIHDHFLEYPHNYALFYQLPNSNLFTHRRILMLLREATSETYGPRVYSHHTNLHRFSYFLCFYFLLCIFIPKIPKILYLSDLTLVSDREGIDNP